MHPYIEKKRTRALVVGWGLVVFGVLGLVLPILQGFVLIAAGLSILSLYVPFIRDLRITMMARFPRQLAALARVEHGVLGMVRMTTHTREYLTIKNRRGTALAAICEISTAYAGTALILHSASGTKDCATAELLADACRVRGMSVVHFDAENSMGESDGAYTLFRASGYLEDVEDVVKWARAQPWFSEPFVLLGHSVGGLVAGLYASAHPEMVQDLVLLAPTVSGARYSEAYEQNDPTGFQTWRESGSRSVRNQRTGVDEGLSFAFVEDLLAYDLVRDAGTIRCPTYILVGDEDRTTLVGHGEELARALGQSASMRIVSGLRHTPLEAHEFAALRRALDSWHISPRGEHAASDSTP